MVIYYCIFYAPCQLLHCLNCASGDGDGVDDGDREAFIDAGGASSHNHIYIHILIIYFFSDEKITKY